MVPSLLEEECIKFNPFEKFDRHRRLISVSREVISLITSNSLKMRALRERHIYIYMLYIQILPVAIVEFSFYSHFKRGSYMYIYVCFLDARERWQTFENFWKKTHNI